MKSIFKFAAIALMACPLVLASCGETPEDDPTDTTPVTPIDPTPTTSINLTWDGEAQTLGFKDAYQSQTYEQLLVLDVAKGMNGEEYELPEFVFEFWNSAEGGLRLAADFNFNVTDPETREVTQVEGNDMFPTEVYEEGALTIGENQYGDYQFYGHNSQPVYGQFDATTMTFDCNLNLKFYNMIEFLTAYQGLGLTEGEEPTQEQLTAVWAATTKKNLTLSIAYYPFTNKK